MVDLRKCEDEKSKQHWAFVEATSNIVRRWPRWKVAAAGLCPLCELGLTSDATAWPKYTDLVTRYAEERRIGDARLSAFEFTKTKKEQH
jgi:hypothetical protein